MADGIHHVKQLDVTGVDYKRRITRGKSNAVLPNFFPKQNSPESGKTTFAKFATQFYCIKHNISFNSIYSRNKLLPQLFTDSNIEARTFANLKLVGLDEFVGHLTN